MVSEEKLTRVADVIVLYLCVWWYKANACS